MKDFQELLESEQKQGKKHHYQLEHMDSLNEDNSSFDFQYFKNKAIKIASPFLLAIVTSPFNTASMLLQISDKPISDPLKKKLELVKNTKGRLQSYVKLGIFGDNKIYRPAEYKNYGDCLRQMGKQGLKGLYKGALTGIIFSLMNSNIRTILYEQTIKLTNQREIWKKNIYTILTCTLSDILTLPIMMCQSRLVFQNSTANFRTYQNPLSVLKKVGTSNLFAGGSLILFKNVLFSYSWLSFFKQSPVYSFIFSTLLSHLTTYPFITVMRQLQCNDKGIQMMHQREQKARECIQRIWRTQKLWGFYRGFFGYTLVHSFLGFIMIESNMRTGYFDQIHV